MRQQEFYCPSLNWTLLTASNGAQAVMPHVIHAPFEGWGCGCVACKKVQEDPGFWFKELTDEQIKLIKESNHEQAHMVNGYE